MPTAISSPGIQWVVIKQNGRKASHITRMHICMYLLEAAVVPAAVTSLYHKPARVDVGQLGAVAIAPTSRLQQAERVKFLMPTDCRGISVSLRSSSKCSVGCFWVHTLWTVCTFCSLSS
jgi:hypothetical protein